MHSCHNTAHVQTNNMHGHKCWLCVDTLDARRRFSKPLVCKLVKSITTVQLSTGYGVPLENLSRAGEGTKVDS